MVFTIKKTKTGRFLVFEKVNGKSKKMVANKPSRKEAQDWIRDQ